MERPSLCACILGFDAETENRIANTLRGLDARWRPAWRVGSELEADAYLLSPKRFALLSAQADAAEHSPAPAIAAVDLSAHSPGGEMEADVNAAVLAAVLRLELLLRGRLNAYRVGAQVFRRYRLGLQVEGVWDLSAGKRTVARIDFDAMQAVLDADATTDEISRAVWHDRPRLAAQAFVPGVDVPALSATVLPIPVPSDVARPAPVSVLEMMWLFARYCPDHLMPEHYRYAKFRLAGLPPIPSPQISAAELRLIRVLRETSPTDFNSLQLATGFTPLAVGNRLAALLFAGSVHMELADSAPARRRGSADSVPSSALSISTSPRFPESSLPPGMTRAPLPQALRSWLAATGSQKE
jgi:hypothetical protein